MQRVVSKFGALSMVLMGCDLAPRLSAQPGGSIERPSDCLAAGSVPAAVACLKTIARPRGAGATVPGPDEAEALEGAVEAMLNGRCAAGPLEAPADGWMRALVEFGGDRLCVLVEDDPLDPDGLSPSGWGTVFVRLGDAEPIHLQAPHPLADRNTPEIAADVFGSVRGRSLVVAGSHRRAAHEVGACDRNHASDAAHDPRHLVQLVTRAIESAADTPDYVVTQIHGMAGGTCPGIDVFLSPGHRNVVEPGPLRSLALMLRTMAPDWRIETVETDEGACHLVGRTNVQRRLLDGAADVCAEQGPPAAHGRFLHVEVGPEVRFDPRWAALPPFSTH